MRKRLTPKRISPTHAGESQSVVRWEGVAMKIYHRITSILLVPGIPVIFSMAFAQSPAYYSIRGDVRDAFGEFVSGVRVCASYISPEPRKYVVCARSDEKGRFTLKLTKHGRYSVSYDKVSDRYMPQNRAYYRDPSAPIPVVDLDDNSPTSIISLSLSARSGVVTGKAIDTQTQLPVEDIQITMCHVDSSQACFSMSAKNIKGEFRVLASLVPFTLKITADGYEDWFGMTGSNAPIYVPSDTTLELSVRLRRRKETIDSALSESEKQVGTHLPAPVQLSPQENVVFNHFPRITKLKWEPVEGAVSYTVEIDFCEWNALRKPDCVNPQPLRLKENPTTTGIVTTSYEFLFIGAQPGRWRVWSTDKEGRAGFRSTWRTFIYLR